MNRQGAYKGHGTDADLESYLGIEGVTAAALSSARGLARDGGIKSPRFIALDLVEKAVILASLNDELFLVLTGGRRILSLPAESSLFA